MRKHLILLLTLALCLSLAACGDTGQEDPLPPESDLTPVTGMTFLDGMWSIDGGAKLYFDSENGFYAYRTYWGLGGRGEFSRSEASGRPMIWFNGFLYDFLLRDDGVLLPNQNGEGSDAELAIHRHTFRRDNEAEIVEWEASTWDGMWQNVLGETIVIDASLMEYTACSSDYAMNGSIHDDGEGMGLYLYDNGTRAYLCPGGDGNSFTLSGERPGRYGDDQHFDGVFYRNGDFEAYTDLENASFYCDDGSAFAVWYYDGVNTYFLGDEYVLGDDGLAYHEEDGLVYPAGWIPETPCDPAADWSVDGTEHKNSRRNVLSGEDVPVLLGGALPFANMRNLRADTGRDGTYRYEDITEDGKILVVNTAEPSCFVPDVQDMEDYLTACALSLSDADTYELLSAEEKEVYSENLGAPVFVVKYTAGEGEDTRTWTVFAADNGGWTYLYGFCETAGAAENMGEIYRSIFERLYFE